MIKPRESFHFNPPIQTKEEWLIGLTSLEVYISIIKITENNKLELYKIPEEKAGDISYTKVKSENEKDLGISDITAVDLQHETIAPINIEEYRDQVTKRMENVGYLNILSGYPRSVFQDFGIYLRTDDIRLVLDEYKLSFITCNLEPGIYTFKGLSEALFNILQHEYPSNSEIAIEYDDITMKTELFVKSGIIAKKFDEKMFFNTVLGCNHDWGYNTIMNILVKKL